jgi:putative PIN family toxin of toxin-antitoxin system
MHKVIVDTNVFNSGVVYGGNPRKIIQLWLENKYIFCLSPELKAEILGKLKRKFLLPKENLKNIEESLDVKSKKYIPKAKVTISKIHKIIFSLNLQ